MSVRRISNVSLLCLTVFSTTATADSNRTDELELLRAEVAQLRDTNLQLQTLREEVRTLRVHQEENWLSERRAEEVKSLIHEVLSDADTRASLLGSGTSAGHNGKGFFLASEDGSFKLKIVGQMQLRFVANSRDKSGSDDLETGFTLRRTKLSFSGHIADPKIKYDIVLAAERGNTDAGEFLLEDFIIGYALSDELTIKIGQMKLPFLREELISSKRQLAVDRSSVTEYFTLDRGQGVQLALSSDNLKAMFMVSDGADTESADFDEDPTDIALTGRVDILLAGKWKQAKDLVAWNGENFGAFVGAAIHHEIGETGSTGANNNFTAWTVDGLVESNGLSVMGAVNGLNTSREGGTPDFDDLGFLVQIGCMLTEQIQPYVRYELLDLDGFDEITLMTAGANYFFKKHNAKLTIDVVYGKDPLTQPSGTSSRRINNPFSDGLGLLSDAAKQDGQIAVRTQFQLLF